MNRGRIVSTLVVLLLALASVNAEEARGVDAVPGPISLSYSGHELVSNGVPNEIVVYPGFQNAEEFKMMTVSASVNLDYILDVFIDDSQIVFDYQTDLPLTGTLTPASTDFFLLTECNYGSNQQGGKRGITRVSLKFSFPNPPDPPEAPFHPVWVYFNVMCGDPVVDFPTDFYLRIGNQLIINGGVVDPAFSNIDDPAANTELAFLADLDAAWGIGQYLLTGQVNFSTSDENEVRPVTSLTLPNGDPNDPPFIGYFNPPTNDATSFKVHQPCLDEGTPWVTGHVKLAGYEPVIDFYYWRDCGIDLSTQR